MILRRKYRGLDLSEKNFSEPLSKEDLEKLKKARELASKNLIKLSEDFENIANKYENNLEKISVENPEIFKKLLNYLKENFKKVEIIEGDKFEYNSNTRKITIKKGSNNIIPLAHEIGHVINHLGEVTDLTRIINRLNNAGFRNTFLRLNDMVKVIRSGISKDYYNNPNRKEENYNKVTNSGIVVLYEEISASLNGIKLLKDFGISEEDLTKVYDRLSKAINVYILSLSSKGCAISSNNINPNTIRLWIP